jgi:ABC-2 type transport system ATP-binding protein
MSPAVVVRQLSKRYGSVEAVRGIDFEIGTGEIFGLLGPNGAGKTTTLECLTGLREPDAGELAVCGIDVRRQPQAAKEKIGVALQTSALPDKITPREALELFGSFYRERVAAAALLERFALGEKSDAHFDTLSGGQRQRLALALAFVNRPGLVVLDEPAVGLDPQARRDLHGEILRMKREGQTVLLSTHQLDEAELLCDRIAILVEGRVVAVGAPRDLIARSSAHQTVTLETTAPLARDRFAGVPGIEELVVTGGRAQFRTAQTAATLGALATLIEREQIDVIELRVRKASLEDVYLGLTREPAAGRKGGA